MPAAALRPRERTALSARSAPGRCGRERGHDTRTHVRRCAYEPAVAERATAGPPTNAREWARDPSPPRPPTPAPPCRAAGCPPRCGAPRCPGSPCPRRRGAPVAGPGGPRPRLVVPPRRADPAGCRGRDLPLGRPAGQRRPSRQPRPGGSSLLLPRRPGLRRRCPPLGDRALRHRALRRPHGPAPAAGLRGGARDRPRRADHPAPARRDAGGPRPVDPPGPPLAGREGDRPPTGRLAPLHGRDVGEPRLAALRRRAGGPPGPRRGARPLHGDRPPLLVAGGRARSKPMASPPRGAPLLPLPPDAPQLPPRRGDPLL